MEYDTAGSSLYSEELDEVEEALAGGMHNAMLAAGFETDSQSDLDSFLDGEEDDWRGARDRSRAAKTFSSYYLSCFRTGGALAARRTHSAGVLPPTRVQPPPSDAAPGGGRSLWLQLFHAVWWRNHDAVAEMLKDTGLLSEPEARLPVHPEFRVCEPEMNGRRDIGHGIYSKIRDARCVVTAERRTQFMNADVVGIYMVRDVADEPCSLCGKHA
jgi:hypothetical protein